MDPDTALTPPNLSTNAPPPTQRSTAYSDEQETKHTLTSEATDLLDYMIQSQDQEQELLMEPLRPMPSLVIPSEEARTKLVDIYRSLRSLLPVLTDDQMAAIMAYHEEVYLSVHREFFDSILAAQEESASSSNSSPQPQSETGDHHIEQEQEQEQEHEQEIERQESQFSSHRIEQEKVQQPEHQESSGSREGYIRKPQDTRDFSTPVAQDTVHPSARQCVSLKKSSHRQGSFHPYDRQCNSSRTSPSRYQCFPFRYQGSPSRHQGSPSRHQGFPSQYQGPTRQYYRSSSHRYGSSPYHYGASDHRQDPYPHRHNSPQGLSSHHQDSYPYQNHPRGSYSHQYSSSQHQDPDLYQHNSHQNPPSHHQNSSNYPYQNDSPQRSYSQRQGPYTYRNNGYQGPSSHRQDSYPYQNNYQGPSSDHQDPYPYENNNPQISFSQHHGSSSHHQGHSTFHQDHAYPSTYKNNDSQGSSSRYQGPIDKGKGKCECLECPLHCPLESRDEYPGIYGEQRFGDDNSDYLYDRNRFPRDSGSPRRSDKENQFYHDPMPDPGPSMRRATDRTNRFPRPSSPLPPPPPPPPLSPPLPPPYPPPQQQQQEYEGLPSPLFRQLLELLEQQRQLPPPPPQQQQQQQQQQKYKVLPSPLFRRLLEQQRRRQLPLPLHQQPLRQQRQRQQQHRSFFKRQNQRRLQVKLPRPYPEPLPPQRPSPLQRFPPLPQPRTQWPNIRPPSPGLLSQLTPFEDSLFGRSTDIGIFYNKWKRSQARDLGFADRSYWFDRDRRSSLPANMGRNMSLVWSPHRTARTEPAPEQAQQAPEVVTEEEDEVMEEGQAAGYDAPNVPSEGQGVSDSSGSTQPVWTLENDIATDMELLPARRTGMRLRSQTRMKIAQGSGDATSSSGSSSDALRYDPGSPSLGWRG